MAEKKSCVRKIVPKQPMLKIIVLRRRFVKRKIPKRDFFGVLRLTFLFPTRQQRSGTSLPMTAFKKTENITWPILQIDGKTDKTDIVENACIVTGVPFIFVFIMRRSLCP